MFKRFMIRRRRRMRRRGSLRGLARARAAMAASTELVPLTNSHLLFSVHRTPDAECPRSSASHLAFSSSLSPSAPSAAIYSFPLSSFLSVFVTIIVHMAYIISASSPSFVSAFYYLARGTSVHHPPLLSSPFPLSSFPLVTFNFLFSQSHFSLI